MLPEPNEPVFHAEWERRAFALTLAMARPGGWNIDMSRFARENRPPDDYLAQELLPDLARRARAADARARPGHAGRDRGRQAAASAQSRCDAAVAPPTSPAMLRRGGPTDASRDDAGPLRGRRPRPRRRTSIRRRHTRLPRYVRGHVGTIELLHGCHVFPDSQRRSARRRSAMALHRDASTAANCGARTATRPLNVSVDAWESYLEPPDGARSASRARGRAVPGIPRDADGPVFREPWEAQAFAMAVALHERGLFTWTEWAAALADEIKRAQAAGDPDTGETYYRHWLATLERLVADKGVANARIPCIAIATPGTTPPTARRTASRSSCARRLRLNAHQTFAHDVTGQQSGAEEHDDKCRGGFQSAQQKHAGARLRLGQFARRDPARRPRSWRWPRR